MISHDFKHEYIPELFSESVKLLSHYHYILRNIKKSFASAHFYLGKNVSNFVSPTWKLNNWCVCSIKIKAFFLTN